MVADGELQSDVKILCERDESLRRLEPIVALMHGEAVLNPVLEKIRQIVEKQGVWNLSFRFLPTFSLY